MSKKYEITDITHPYVPRLRRIRALRDIPTAWVQAGDLGGWVEGEHNLGHDGNAWVSGMAQVHGMAQVAGSAQVHGMARVSGSAIVQSSEDIMHSMVLASSTYNSTLHRTTDGHLLTVGCWRGTVPEFRTMIESDKWVEATPAQIKLRRPELLAFADMCEARIATWEQP